MISYIHMFLIVSFNINVFPYPISDTQLLDFNPFYQSNCLTRPYGIICAPEVLPEDNSNKVFVPLKRTKVRQCMLYVIW